MGVDVVENVSYVESEDEPVNPRQTLDLYLPEDAEDFPMIVYAHGGVWRLGSKDQYANIGHTFAQEGIGVAVINYRLTPEVTHPAHTQDVAQAFNWIIENIADYGGDPERSILTGHSAGGHIISLLALDSQYLDAVDRSIDDIMGIVAYSGVFVIDDWIVGWAEGVFSTDSDERTDASPLSLVPNHADNSEDLPPFLLIASENDYPELIVEMNDMRDALDAIGVEVESSIIADRDHFGLVAQIGSDDDATTAQVLAWLRQQFEIR